jgi:hypothetical protein
MGRPDGLSLVDEIVAETDTYRVWYGAEADLVFIEWEQSAPESAYKAGMEQVLASVLEYDARKYLCDARALEAGQHWRDTLTWAIDEWLVKFATTTVESVVIVYPDDPVGRFITDEMGRAREHDDINLTCVTDLETAVMFLSGSQDG